MEMVARPRHITTRVFSRFTTNAEVPGYSAVQRFGCIFLVCLLVFGSLFVAELGRRGGGSRNANLFLHTGIP